MWKEIREFLGYNKSERRGVATLLVLLLILIVLNAAMPALLLPYLKRTDKKKIVALQELLNEVKINDKSDDSKFSVIKVSLDHFNPNTASEAKLMGLGFNGRQAKMIVNFRDKGGRFRIRSDLRKIYSVSETDFERFEPYIRLPAALSPHTGTRSMLQEESIKKTAEINSADSAELVQLRGIGPVFAKRIIKYRQLIGGYVDINQLLEIYGMKQEYFVLIKDQVTIDTSLVIRLDLVTDEFKTLLRHPYLDYQTTKIICNARRSDTLISSMKILRYLLTEVDSTLIKLEPYLLH